MNGTRTLYRSFGMALSFLGGLFVAAFHPAALAANPPAPTTQVSATVNPTTYYYEPTKRTFRVPPSATISPIKDVALPTVQKLPNGALAQQISSGIEITALKGGQLRGPIYGRITAGVSSLRAAATGCFKSGRCNVALMAGALGLQALFDGLDWVMGDGGKITRSVDVPVDNSNCAAGEYCWNSNGATPYYPSPLQACLGMAPKLWWGSDTQFTHMVQLGGNTIACHYRNSKGETNNTGTYRVGSACPSGSTLKNGVCSTSTQAPVSPDEIESAVADDYNPEPSDFRFLIPEIDLGADDVNAEITDAPRLQAPPVTTTIYDANGVPVEVQETNTWVDFAPKNNPSKQPALDAVETEKTDTYNKNGEPTGSKTETKPQAAPPAGAIVIPPAPPDIPTDCAFMPTVCQWLDWFKKDEPTEEPNLDDAKQVIDLRDYKENVTIGPTAQQCPEPMEFTVPYVNATVAVSWQPFCDLADLVRPLLLLLAYFGGAVLTIRSI